MQILLLTHVNTEVHMSQLQSFCIKFLNIFKSIARTIKNIWKYLFKKEFSKNKIIKQWKEDLLLFILQGLTTQIISDEALESALEGQKFRKQVTHNRYQQQQKKHSKPSLQKLEKLSPQKRKDAITQCELGIQLYTMLQNLRGESRKRSALHIKSKSPKTLDVIFEDINNKAHGNVFSTCDVATNDIQEENLEALIDGVIKNQNSVEIKSPWDIVSSLRDHYLLSPRKFPMHFLTHLHYKLFYSTKDTKDKTCKFLTIFLSLPKHLQDTLLEQIEKLLQMKGKDAIKINEIISLVFKSPTLMNTNKTNDDTANKALEPAKLLNEFDKTMGRRREQDMTKGTSTLPLSPSFKRFALQQGLFSITRKNPQSKVLVAETKHNQMMIEMRQGKTMMGGVEQNQIRETPTDQSVVKTQTKSPFLFNNKPQFRKQRSFSSIVKKVSHEDLPALANSANGANENLQTNTVLI